MRDGIGYIIYKLGFLQRIPGSLMQQQITLERYKVTLIGRNILLHFFKRVLSRERVRVFRRRQLNDFNVHPLCKYHRNPTQSRMYSRRITIIHDGHILGKLVYQTYLLHSKGRTTGSHHIADSKLVHHHHIDIAFHQDTFVQPRYLSFGEIYSKQVTAFYINLCLRRIDILGRIFRAKGSAAESDHTSADRMNGKHHPLPEFIYNTSVIPFHGKPGPKQIFHLVAGRHRRIHQ